MRTSRKLTLTMAVSAVAAFTALVPAAASAETYQPADGTYAGSVQNDGLCIPPVICPSVTNTVVGAGGADGGSYLQSSLLGLATTELATTKAIWTSPLFTYNGNGGALPATVSFDMFRQADVAGLLGLDVLNRATFSVDLVHSAGARINAVPETTLAGAPTWTSVTGTINPGLLVVGQSYRIEITTTYKAAAAVVIMGSADYDLATLAAAGTSGGGNGGGGNGGGGGGSPYGSPYGAGTGTLSALAGYQQCVKNVKKKVKKLKVTKKKKKKILKKKKANCARKFKVKIKKKKKRRRRR